MLESIKMDVTKVDTRNPIVDLNNTLIRRLAYSFAEWLPNAVLCKFLSPGGRYVCLLLYAGRTSDFVLLVRFACSECWQSAKSDRLFKEKNPREKTINVLASL